MKVTVWWRGQWLFRWPTPLPTEVLRARIESIGGPQLNLLLSNFQVDRELDDQGQIKFINEWDGAIVVNGSCNVLAVTVLRDIKFQASNDTLYMRWTCNRKHTVRYTHKCTFTPLKLVIDSYWKPQKMSISLQQKLSMHK